VSLTLLLALIPLVGHKKLAVQQAASIIQPADTRVLGDEDIKGGGKCYLGVEGGGRVMVLAERGRDSNFCDSRKMVSIPKCTTSSKLTI
jgi:hypothetical protein